MHQRTDLKLTSHVGKLLAAALQVVSVLGLHGILDGAGDGVVGTENGALHQFDLTGQATLETTATASSCTRLLPLFPGLCRAGVAAGIWRCGAVDTELSGGVVVAASRRVHIRAGV